MLPTTISSIRDPARLAVLRRLQLLDTPEEEVFDRLTRFASRKLGVPIALVNLIDADRQFFKSAGGMGDLRELPVATGVCSYTLTVGKPLVIEDARSDPRFADNPIVTDYGLVAYVGIPLTISTGHSLGTFCVVDTEARTWGEHDVETVRNLAGAAIMEIEMRLDALELEESAEAEPDSLVADADGQTLRELTRQIAWTIHSCLSIIEDLESAADWREDVKAGDLVKALVTNIFSLSHTFWPGGRRRSDRLITKSAGILRSNFGMHPASSLHWRNLEPLRQVIHLQTSECDDRIDLKALTVTLDGEEVSLQPIVQEIRGLWVKIVSEVDQLSAVAVTW